MFSLLPILSLVFKFATGAGGIGETIVKLQAQKAASESATEKLDLDRQIAELQARQALQQGNDMDTAMRASMALPFEVYIWKVVVWDNVLGWGTTPALSTSMAWIMGTVISFYFLGTTKIGK